jgi:iron-sulfur cluster repair protein YtfE (RIC family)
MNGFSELGQALHDEHRQTLEVMNGLEDKILGASATRPFDPSDNDDRRRLEDLIAVVDRDTGSHFRFEEEVLFPIFDEAGAGDMTRMLIQEHEVIRTLGSQLRMLAEAALANGFDEATWSDFRTAAMDLAASVTFHIQKEEMGLIGRLSFFVDPGTDHRLAQQHAEYAA